MASDWSIGLSDRIVDTVPRRLGRASIMIIYLKSPLQ